MYDVFGIRGRMQHTCADYYVLVEILFCLKYFVVRCQITGRNLLLILSLGFYYNCDGKHSVGFTNNNKSH